jgi:nucleoside transporter
MWVGILSVLAANDKDGVLMDKRVQLMAGAKTKVILPGILSCQRGLRSLFSRLFSRSMKSPAAKKLFVMMVLEFFIWGAWLPLIWGYMGKDGLDFTAGQITWVGSAFAIASILGIFFSNQFADRNFAAEKFMSFSHLVGGLAILGMYWAKDFPTFFGLMLVHSMLYVPTISVSNSIAFTHLKDAKKEFGLVRMGGTIGWMLAAWPLYFVLEGKQGAEAVEASRNIFLVSGISSLVLAVFSLSLPHTPPKPAQAGESGFAWLHAVKFLKKPFLLVLFIVTFIDSTIHNGYFLMAGGFLGSSTVGIDAQWIMPVMSIGQIAEIVTMAMLGWFLSRMGWKTTMILGVLGHAARFAVFAFMPENQTMIILVQVLHGVCYAFFFATLYIFIDAAFPKDVRSSAQGLFNLLVLGLGDLAAKWIFIPLQGSLTTDGVVNYRELFLWPTGMSLAAALLLLFAFWPPKDLDAPAEVGH